MGGRIIRAFCPVLLAMQCLILCQAQAQNARWPSAGDAEPRVLRAYGSGSAEAGLREASVAFGNERGVMVVFKSGPVAAWKDQATRDGDIIFADSQLMMNNFVHGGLQSVIDPATVRTLSLHPSFILVRKGNPKKIRSVRDLTKPGLRLLMIAEPEGRWEDTARRAGGEGLVQALRRNLEHAPATAAEAQALWESDQGYDAWLDLRPGQAESPKVISRQEATTYRACALALTSRTPQKDLAQEFIDFVFSGQGEEIFSRSSGKAR